MSNKKGFTLIELLIVVVIIGIQPRLRFRSSANTKDKAYVAAMKSDLRNMATYEDSTPRTTTARTSVEPPPLQRRLQGFTPSQNVTVVVTTFRPAAFMAGYRNALAVRRRFAT